MFHLIFSVAARDSGSEGNTLPFVQDPLMFERLEEIHAGLLSLLLIFDLDQDAFNTYQALLYCKSPGSACDDDADTVVRFTEMLIRCFWVIEAIPPNTTPDVLVNSEWESRGNLDEISNRFKDFVTRVGPQFSEYERLFSQRNKQKIHEYIVEQFKDIHPLIAKHMGSIWQDVMRLYRHFLDTAGCFRDEMRKTAKERLEKGEPIIRTLMRIPSGRKSRGRDAEICGPPEEDPGTDTLGLICCLLYEYMLPFKTAGCCSMHLRRAGQKRTPHYPDTGKRWFEFQVDRGFTPLFCPVPSVRRERLRKQIVLLKTFWDISSELRGRRLRAILDDNFP